MPDGTRDGYLITSVLPYALMERILVYMLCLLIYVIIILFAYITS